MSQLSDIIELIRTTNEVYFITAPERVRAVFILVDDLVELSLKTYLFHHTIAQRKLCKTDLQAKGLIQNDDQVEPLDKYFKGEISFEKLAEKLGQNGEKAVNKLQTILDMFGNLRHWSVNKPETRKDFDDVVNEVKALHPTNAVLIGLLDKAFQRHTLRNKLYHDHHSTGWSIKDEKCLEAMCDLFDLLNELFPSLNNPEGFAALIQQTKTTRCQIGVLRLKLAAMKGASGLDEPYNEALKVFKNNTDLKNNLKSRGLEHSVLHIMSEDLFVVIRRHLQSKVDVLKKQLDDQNTKLVTINSIKQVGKQQAKIDVTQSQLAIMVAQLTALESLIKTP